MALKIGNLLNVHLKGELLSDIVLGVLVELAQSIVFATEFVSKILRATTAIIMHKVHELPFKVVDSCYV
jgi:hypothetical protein